ncbi:MAG: hypothetical protein A2Z91_02595 [Deltaproteobacteria bacterium GWA2_38_16]|nr:MAG: hypothetical protein A2Z91_02595 [Deltaproteobacteria bacterium GWA2_38_16]OGQ02082.1 MAG: hypothetical protein A3D19_08890 [Deltaproteobacteria bacterium RIFCSPHIGHO2_02_FULL_38_15]OGQ32534.1 MAG: hypothetical protein A3A72_03045 [Deltaproteobacteria bacterium RIFCSPLOWO2_01_FULL_38_9]OGQ63059.1 MAG: hypothetical protein A3G92_05385 [Deltaproteobacteria bacterium RIFCSPLOWO2_12_FULL_38_8]HBQ21620.1 hypothetical protein [Deltaproteobacteria bacterium]
MKKINLILIIFGVFITFTALAQEDIFQEIADNAPVGNGWASVENYDLNTKKSDLVVQALAELKEEYWENCGPWKTFRGPRTSIRKIKKLEADQGIEVSARRLQSLYDQKKIVALVGTESNNRVECSLHWFNIYGTDGSVLRLRYNLGD